MAAKLVHAVHFRRVISISLLLSCFLKECIMFQGSIVRLEFELSRWHNSGNIGLRGPIWGWKFLQLVESG